MEGKEKGDMKKVLVVGSLNMDMVLSVDHHPVPGETIIGDGITYHPGGKGANQAYAVGKLGGDVRIIGCVGWDNNGMILTENLAQAGVDTTAINRMPETPTGMAIIDVDKKGDNSIIVISGANACLTLDLLRKQKASVEWSDFIMTQLETPIDTVLELARMAKKADKCMILDPSPARADLPDELFPLIDIMKPNEKELSILTGMPTETDEEIKAAADALLEKGVSKVVVTLGARGAMLADGNEKLFFEAKPVVPVDTTAAGAAFTAAMVNGLAQEMGMIQAIRMANGVASIVVTRHGAQASIPDRDEIDDLIWNY